MLAGTTTQLTPYAPTLAQLEANLSIDAILPLEPGMSENAYLFPLNSISTADLFGNDDWNYNLG